MSVRVCLAVIFNHAYPGNIEKLRRLYADRFSRIVFLLPNARVADEACFTGYRGSYSFHGLVADAGAFLRAQDADAYVFVADDLILNPRLTEDTLVDALGLHAHDGFLPSMAFLAGACRVGGSPSPSTAGRDWMWTRRVVSRLEPRHPLFGSGVEGYLAELPDRTSAIRKFLRYGAPLLRLELPAPPATGLGRLRWWRRRTTTHDLPLPMAYGISDLFAARREALDRLVHYLGVLASLDLFVEVAVPTALVLATERLVTARDAGWEFSWAFTGAPGVGLPSPGAPAFVSLDDLRERFPPSMLFLHPVKLSTLAP